METAALWGMPVEDDFQQYSLGRLGTPDEVAKAAAVLAPGDSSYIGIVCGWRLRASVARCSAIMK
jgi:NAD(P)-dependent dehydrogenase (short-subunit alcohol dehydrogenase family)